MNFILTQEEQHTLLSDARETIAAKLEGRSPVYQRNNSLEKAESSALSQSCGAFVTLHIGKDLRGCIGRMTASESLEKTIRVMALEAAFGDPRFPPLTRDELGRCHLEISALSPMELCPDPRSVQVGIHGLYLIHRGRAGVLLPQVPLEQGWDLDAYLDYICIKAGLPSHSYDEPGARLYTFTAVVFGEEREGTE
jgi:AmmeMemoRadiSam system protein A